MNQSELEALIADALTETGTASRVGVWNTAAFAGNPVCGDEVHFRLLIEQRAILDCGYDFKGCLVSKASVALAHKAVIGLSLLALADLIEESVAVAGGNSPTYQQSNLIVHDCLALIAYMRQFPLRQNCVLLPWKALANLTQ